MTKPLYPYHQLLFLFLLAQANSLLITAHQRPARFLAKNVTSATPKGGQVPAASKPCTPEEDKWWQQIRAAGKEYAGATDRKEEALTKAIKRYAAKPGPIPDEENGLLPQDELVKLNEAIKASKEKYIELLRVGKEKSYRALIPDGGLVLLARNRPRYTERARQAGITGTVILQAVFKDDGTIGEVKIVRGLGYGLDERAVEAVQGIVFLPARFKDMFVPSRKSVQMVFNLI
ncbi:MAG TPA: energy transducer TonB [Blastocatellia bacterium]|jgi:TonB family protein|nr:energy transducer TonB [Blastocatellia bacterium]